MTSEEIIEATLKAVAMATLDEAIEAKPVPVNLGRPFIPFEVGFSRQAPVVAADGVTLAFRARLKEAGMLDEQRDWREERQRAPFQPEEFAGQPPTQRARARMVNNWLRHGVLRAPVPSLRKQAIDILADLGRAAWSTVKRWHARPCSLLPCPCERCKR